MQVRNYYGTASDSGAQVPGCTGGSKMAGSPSVESSRREIPFTIDGKPYKTDDPNQRASALLRLAGLDPALFDLGELEGKERPHTKKFDDNEIVHIHKDARFVSIRQSAPVG